MTRLTFGSFTWSNLKFPLGRHDLCIDTGDFDPGIQTRLVVRFNNVSAVNLLGPNTAVVWALRAREPSMGPAIWPAIRAKHRVLLLEAEPRLLRGVGIHQTSSLVTEVELVGAAIMIPALAQDKDVVATAERIGVDGDGAKIDIRVAALSLAAR